MKRRLAIGTMLVVTAIGTMGQQCVPSIPPTLSNPCSWNAPPQAYAGPDQEGEVGTRVYLDALGSTDPEGESLSFTWVQVRGEAVPLDGAYTATPSFLPAMDGVYEFTVTASDSCGASDDDTVRVSIAPPFQQSYPVAQASANPWAVEEGKSATLDGSWSYDPEGLTLSYSWRQTGGAAVMLANPNAAITSFVAPMVTADIPVTFELTVTNQWASDTATVTVTVTDTTLPPGTPVADAGPDQTVSPGATVTLDGSASYDPNSLELDYSWSQIAGPLATLADSMAVTTTFVAPDVLSDTILTFQLWVSNGPESATATTNVLVQPSVTPLTASATADNQQVAAGDRTTLRALVEGGTSPYVCTWSVLTMPSGANASMVTIDNPASQDTDVAFAMDASEGDYSFGLQVTDAAGGMAGDAVTIRLEIPTIVTDDHPNSAPGTSVAADCVAIDGMIDPGGDWDYFQFGATGGYSYVMETSGSTDTYMYLYSTNGTTELTHNDDGGTGYNASISWDCPSSGTYHIGLRHWSSGGTGAYQLAVCVDDDHGNSWSYATLVNTDGSAVSGNIEIPGDVDFFRFNAETGANYVMETSGSTDTYMYLYSTNGTTELTHNDDGGVGLNSRIAWDCPASGTYYVKIRHYSSSRTGTYALSVTGTVAVDISADFHNPTIVMNGCSVTTYGTYYNSYYGDSWRMLFPNSSYLSASFNLDFVPGTVMLRVTHLSSGSSGCPGGGYSPVDFRINGVVFLDDYDVAQNHGGSHSFQTDEWNISSYLRTGSNSILIELESSCTHYWIQMLEVTSQ